MEKMVADNVVYHKTCFRCSHCKRVLRCCTIILLYLLTLLLRPCTMGVYDHCTQCTRSVQVPQWLSVHCPYSDCLYTVPLHGSLRSWDVSTHTKIYLRTSGICENAIQKVAARIILLSKFVNLAVIVKIPIFRNILHFCKSSPKFATFCQNIAIFSFLWKNIDSHKIGYRTFYGLAVKTESIALQKFFFFFFVFFGLRKKVIFLGSKYFFPDSLQKKNVTT